MYKRTSTVWYHVYEIAGTGKCTVIEDWRLAGAREREDGE
jgi:hypothetical protein